MREAGAATARSFIETLMDAYQNPHVDTDNSEVISNLEKQVYQLRKQNEAYDQSLLERDATICELKEKLEAARNEANDNAAKAQQIQTSTEGCIILKPNPVSAYFLNEMAEKEKTTPGKILERLFIDDLQNPRANNLPYTVESSRIREVMKELKNNQNQ